MIANYTKKLVDNLPKEFKNKKKPIKLDLVLDGGVFNGSYLFGALYFLKEMEHRKYINIEKISGSSVGSIAGLIYFIDCLDYYQYLYEIVVNDLKKTYNLKNIVTNTQKQFLTLTTLFKHDYHLFPFFYNYYTKQGVSHFYLYYNGIIMPEIYTLFNQPRYKNVTLIEWNFHYWNPRNFKYWHHAQMGQIHHALYRYGKDISEYMIFCDFDEYLHIPSPYPRRPFHLLHNYIKDNPGIDIFGFCNIWADTSQYQYPHTQMIPKKILAVAEHEHNPYCERSKNIYKVSSIKTFGIHQLCDDAYFHKLKSITNLKMYHFYKWSSKTRIIENCTNVKDFEF